MDKIIEDLNKLKKSIDAAKTEGAVLIGRRDEALKQLKEVYNLISVEAAEKWLVKMEKELQATNKAIEKSYQKLKENYEW